MPRGGGIFDTIRRCLQNTCTRDARAWSVGQSIINEGPRETGALRVTDTITAFGLLVLWPLKTTLQLAVYIPHFLLGTYIFLRMYTSAEVVNHVVICFVEHVACLSRHLMWRGYDPAKETAFYSSYVTSHTSGRSHQVSDAIDSSIHMIAHDYSAKVVNQLFTHTP